MKKILHIYATILLLAVIKAEDLKCYVCDDCATNYEKHYETCNIGNESSTESNIGNDGSEGSNSNNNNSENNTVENEIKEGNSNESDAFNSNTTDNGGGVGENELIGTVTHESTGGNGSSASDSGSELEGEFSGVSMPIEGTTSSSTSETINVGGNSTTECNTDKIILTGSNGSDGGSSNCNDSDIFTGGNKTAGDNSNESGSTINNTVDNGVRLEKSNSSSGIQESSGGNGSTGINGSEFQGEILNNSRPTKDSTSTSSSGGIDASQSGTIEYSTGETVSDDGNSADSNLSESVSDGSIFIISTKKNISSGGNKVDDGPKQENSGGTNLEEIDYGTGITESDGSVIVSNESQVDKSKEGGSISVNTSESGSGPDEVSTTDNVSEDGLQVNYSNGSIIIGSALEGNNLGESSTMKSVDIQNDQKDSTSTNTNTNTNTNTSDNVLERNNSLGISSENISISINGGSIGSTDLKENNLGSITWMSSDTGENHMKYSSTPSNILEKDNSSSSGLDSGTSESFPENTSVANIVGNNENKYSILSGGGPLGGGSSLVENISNGNELQGSITLNVTTENTLEDTSINKDDINNSNIDDITISSNDENVLTTDRIAETSINNSYENSLKENLTDIVGVNEENKKETSFDSAGAITENVTTGDNTDKNISLEINTYISDLESSNSTKKTDINGTSEGSILSSDSENDNSNSSSKNSNKIGDSGSTILGKTVMNGSSLGDIINSSAVVVSDDGTIGMIKINNNSASNEEQNGANRTNVSENIEAPPSKNEISNTDDALNSTMPEVNKTIIQVETGMGKYDINKTETNNTSAVLTTELNNSSGNIAADQNQYSVQMVDHKSSQYSEVSRGSLLRVVREVKSKALQGARCVVTAYEEKGKTKVKRGCSTAGDQETRCLQLMGRNYTGSLKGCKVCEGDLCNSGAKAMLTLVPIVLGVIVHVI